MFSFGRIFKKCSGCQLLWSDPNKQAGAYDAVDKEDNEEKEDPDLEPLSPSSIVLSQPTHGPSWSLDMESPIVKNQSPIVRNSSKSSSLDRNASFSGQNSPIVKTRTPPRDAFSSSNSPIVKTRTPSKNASTGGKSSSKSNTQLPNAFRSSASSEHIAGQRSQSKNTFKTSASIDQLVETDKNGSFVSSSSPDISSKGLEYGPTVHASKAAKKVKKTNSELALQVVSVV